MTLPFILTNETTQASNSPSSEMEAARLMGFPEARFLDRRKFSILFQGWWQSLCIGVHELPGVDLEKEYIRNVACESTTVSNYEKSGEFYSKNDIGVNLVRIASKRFTDIVLRRSPCAYKQHILETIVMMCCRNSVPFPSHYLRASETDFAKIAHSPLFNSEQVDLF